MLISALFLTPKQNPFCREPHFVKAGRSCISIRTVGLENETTIKEIVNSGPMIKSQLPGWYAKEAYWRLSWTLGTTFKTEAVQLNPADWHKKKLPLSPRLKNIQNFTCVLLLDWGTSRGSNIKRVCKQRVDSWSSQQLQEVLKLHNKNNVQNKIVVIFYFLFLK